MDNIQQGKEIINKIVQRKTLRLFRAGCEEKNYVILMSLPLTAQEIEIKIDRTPMPTNKRIKELMATGLISREKPGKKITLTPLGEEFLEQIEIVKQEVIQEMAQMVK